MTEHDATFEIEDAADARTASRALEELSNRLREDKLAARDATTEHETLASFERLATSIDEDEPGQLIVTYQTEN